MSCNTCQAKFTFFTRETCCPSCRFSYCGKCLKYKFNLPDVGVRKICGKCYFKLKDQVENGATQSAEHKDAEFEPSEGKSVSEMVPVDITQKINSLENPAKPPIVLYQQEVGKWDKLKSGLNSVDQEIADRLRKLKDDKPIPQSSLEAIRRRLALLKDQDPDKPVPKSDIHQVDMRTDQEKITDLINEYMEDLQLSPDANLNVEIEDRIAKLRGIDRTQLPKDKLDEDEDEEAATKKIIKKAIAEAALETKYSQLDELESMDMDQDNTTAEVELPWCIICNEDAHVRCLGCDGDLYCTSCFRQGHDSFEMVDHQSVPFKAKQKPVND